MTDIPSPKRPNDYADRGIDCQFAMELAVQALARKPEAAGWTENNVAYDRLEFDDNT